MKIKDMKKILILTLFNLIAAIGLNAQGNNGTIRGKITDELSQSGIEMAVVKLQAGTQTLGAFTDEKGEFVISGVPVGKHTLEISALGYVIRKVEGVSVSNGSITFIDRELMLKEGAVVEIIYDWYKEDLLGKGTPGTMKRISAIEISQTATLRDVGTIIASSVAKVGSRDDGDPLTFSGSRTGSTLYLIDGVKVIGDPQIPNRGIGEIVVITGGLPAQYGDTTSGVVLISTKSF
jgi:hypothetical protein